MAGRVIVKGAFSNVSASARFTAALTASIASSPFTDGAGRHYAVTGGEILSQPVQGTFDTATKTWTVAVVPVEGVVYRISAPGYMPDCYVDSVAYLPMPANVDVEVDADTLIDLPGGDTQVEYVTLTTVIASIDSKVASAVEDYFTAHPPTGVDAEGIQDVVGALIVAAGGTYDDEAGTITLPTSGIGGLVDDDTTDNAPAIQTALDAGGTVILPPTTGRYYLDTEVVMSVPGTTLVVVGAPLRIRRGRGAVWAAAPDCAIHGNLVVQGDDSPVLTGLNSGSYQGSIPASRWVALSVYQEAHRLKVDSVTAHGMSAAVRIAGWSNGTNAAATLPVEDVTIGPISCSAVEFGIAAKATTRLTVASVKGSYGIAGAPRAGHLLYFADDASMVGHLQPAVGPCQATNGSTGQAFQFKGIRGGGTMGALLADDCDGSLNIMECNGLRIDSLTSLRDYSTSVAGSITIDAVTTVEDVTIGSVRVSMASDGKPLRIISNVDRVSFGLIDVTVNHTTTGGADVYDVTLGGTNVTVGTLRHRNVGTHAWHAVGIWGYGTGTTVNVDRLENVRTGINSRNSAATIYYDIDRITLHSTDGVSRLAVGVTGTALWRGSPITPQLRSPLALAGDDFTLRAAGGLLAGTVSGHVWTAQAGTWVNDFAGRAQETAGAASASVALDAGQANVSVDCGLTHAAGSKGLVVRGIDGANYLFARIHTDHEVQILKRAAGVNTILAATTGLVVAQAMRHQLSVTAVGARIVVMLNGVAVLSHTLTGGDETTFASGTLVGLYTHASSQTRFDTFLVYKAA